MTHSLAGASDGILLAGQIVDRKNSNPEETVMENTLQTPAQGHMPNREAIEAAIDENRG